MTTLIKVTDKKFDMDSVIVNNLNILNQAVQLRWDAPLVIDGVEGAGKTTLTDQICYYQAYTNKTKYNLNNVVFLPDEFERFVDTAPPYTPVNWDEAVFGTLGEDWANTVNKTILKKWVTIRKKRLFINVCIPWIFLMRIYFAVGRTRALIHVWTPDGLKRGYFKIYDYNSKRHLYMKNKRSYTYEGIKPSYDEGRFVDTQGMFYDQKEYDDKKETAIKTLTMERIDKKELLWKHRWAMTTKAYIELGGTQTLLGNILNITQQNISDALKEDAKTYNNLQTYNLHNVQTNRRELKLPPIIK